MSSTASALNSGLSDAAAGLGIYGGLQRGGAQGDLAALASAGKLTGNLTGNASLNAGAGDLGDILGIYSGLQSGGIGGYGTAAADTAKLTGSLTGDAGLSAIGSYIAAPLSLYEFAKNYQSGATGPDALSGAEAGASIGSIVPGIGNLIGGLAGGAIGALSSAFGGGKHDPETTGLQNLIPEYQSATAANPQAAQQALSGLSAQDSFETLAGAFDAKNNSAGHSQPIEQTLGRMQEGTFLDDIANQINSGYASGAITPGESASQVYSSVINPWIDSETGGQGILGPSTGEGGVLTGAIQNLVGDYMNGTLTNSTPIGVTGQTDAQLAAYAGMTPQIAAAAKAMQPAVAPATTPVSAQQTPGMANGATPMAAFTQMAQAQQAQQAQAQAQAQAQQAQAPKAVAARGGLMRKVYYDDGGGVDDTGDDLTSGLDLSNSGILGSTAPAFDTGYASYSAPSAGDVFGNLSTSNALAALPTSQGSSSSGKGLSGLLQGLGLSAGTASTLASLGVTAASLAPIIGALTGATGKGATQPALPAQYTGALNPVATPQMNRTPNPNMQTMTPAQWLHYGEMPEQQFYQNNQVPSAATSTGQQVGSGQPALPPGLLAALMQTQGQGAAATSPAAQAATAQPVQPAYSGVPASGPGMAPIMRAHGGPTYMSQSPYTSAMAGHARGPGDGTSDDINAKLSDGEYVMDAPTVSLLGNGSNEAGARALDAMRQNVRKHAGQKLVKGRQPMHAKTPGQYMDAE